MGSRAGKFQFVIITLTLFISIWVNVPHIFTLGEPTASVSLIPSFTVLSFIGELVTVACIIENAYNLSGLGVDISWDPTYLEYVTHTVTIPVEDYPTPISPSPYGGILHTPEIKFADDVDSPQGTYSVAYSTLGGSPFNGNGTVFIMTFSMRDYPSTFVDVNLHFEDCALGRSFDDGGGSLDRTLSDAVVRILGYNVENHDLAVVEVSTSKNGCLPVPTVGHGYTTDVIVVVENLGEFTETFDIAVYANYTRVNTLHGASLAQGSTGAFTVTWDTSSVVKGYWLVKALLESTTDIDLSDNSMTDGVVLVTLPGDVDGDRDVDIFDVVAMVSGYGSREGDPGYLSNYDIDDDRDIDIFDMIAGIAHYRESWSS